MRWACRRASVCCIQHDNVENFLPKFGLVSCLFQQDLAPVRAGQEDGQRLLLLAQRDDWVVRRQPDLWKRLYDPDDSAGRFHQREVF